MDQDYQLSQSLEANGHKVPLKPEIFSMREYIENHYAYAMFAELEEQINSGKLPRRYGRMLPELEILRPETCKIVKVTFWRVEELTVHVEIVISAQVKGIFSGNDAYLSVYRKREFSAEMWIYLNDDNIECDYDGFWNYKGEAKESEESVKNKGTRLTEYLIPCFGTEDIERETERILRQLCPQALKSPEKLDMVNLPELLGLTVISLPLYRRRKTHSILFFCNGETTIEDENGEPETIMVKGETIVLNSRYPNQSNPKKAVLHECFHYSEHKLFFKLQKLVNADIKCMPKWRPTDGQKADDNPIERMEWQARYGAQCLMMPRCLARKFVESKLLELRDYMMHSGERMDWIGRDMAAEFHVWKSCARNRLIQLGYNEARGALNYVNDGYARPFAFSTDTCGKGQTFVISAEDAFSIYVRDESFRKLLDSDRFVYVDGHYCLDDPRYVRHDDKGVYMTNWANAHVDCCCLRFNIHYLRDSESEYQYGQLSSDDEYNGRQLDASISNDPVAAMKAAKATALILQELPSTFSGSLTAHMSRCKVTIEELAERAHISERTIKRLRAKERRVYAVDQVIALCVGLHLQIDFSEDLVRKAGIVFKNIEDDIIYHGILRTMYNQTIDEVQAALKKAGHRPLRLADTVIEAA